MAFGESTSDMLMRLPPLPHPSCCVDRGDSGGSGLSYCLWAPNSHSSSAVMLGWDSADDKPPLSAAPIHQVLAADVSAGRSCPRAAAATRLFPSSLLWATPAPASGSPAIAKQCPLLGGRDPNSVGSSSQIPGSDHPNLFPCPPAPGACFLHT